MTTEVRPTYAESVHEFGRTMTVAGIAREVHDIHHNAAATTPGSYDFLLRTRLIRKNARTGWFDSTPAGRELIAAALRDGTIERCVWGTC